MAGQEGKLAWLRCLLLAGKGRWKENNERERRSGGGYIKGKFKIITSLPFQLYETCVSFNKWAASHSRNLRLAVVQTQ